MENNPDQRPPAKRVSDSFTTMSELVMPNDTNPMNNLMGGNMLRWMDIACAICAGKHTGSAVVTASVDNVAFGSAIKMGEVITLEASVTRAFNTSLEIFVEVFAASMQGTNPRKTHSAYFTFVALNKDNGKPVPSPDVIPLTEIEQQRYNSAMRRRELRLVLAGRMKPEDATHLKEIF